VSFDDWLLSFHLLSAAAYGSGLVLFWALVVAARGTDTPQGRLDIERPLKVGNAAVGLGAGGTIVFGIWLALSFGGYDLWDGWIVAAIVLWVILAVIGKFTGDAYMEGLKKAQELQAQGQTAPSAELLALNRTTRGLALQTAASVVFVLIVIDMVWKPGA
jgi:hypothetical protein